MGTKISALAAITGANTAAGDLLVITDVSDTTQGAGGTTKSITRDSLLNSGAIPMSGAPVKSLTSGADPYALLQADATAAAGGKLWTLASNATGSAIGTAGGLSVRNSTSGTTVINISDTGLAVTGAVSATTTGKVGTTLGVGNATPSASGAGITFPATQSASTDPNTLDDHEKGTFTPVLRDAAAGNAATAATSIGRYQKDGRMVHFEIVLINIDTTGLTAGNSIVITGLPFILANVVNLYVPCVVLQSAVTSTAGTIIGLINQGAATMSLVNGTTTTTTPVIVSQVTSGSGDLYIQGSYEHTT